MNTITCSRCHACGRFMFNISGQITITAQPSFIHQISGARRLNEYIEVVDGKAIGQWMAWSLIYTDCFIGQLVVAGFFDR